MQMSTGTFAKSSNSFAGFQKNEEADFCQNRGNPENKAFVNVFERTEKLARFLHLLRQMQIGAKSFQLVLKENK